MIALGLPVEISDVEILKEMREKRKKRRKRRKKRKRLGNIRQLLAGSAAGGSAFEASTSNDALGRDELLQMIMNAAPSQDDGKQQGQEQHPLDKERSSTPTKSKFEQLMEGVPYLDSEEEEI